MKKVLGFLLFITYIMFSCEMELNVKLIPKNPLMVLNCAVVSDSTWLLSLTRTGNILDYVPVNFPINNAEITIRNDKNELVETLQTFSPFPPTPGVPTPSQNYNYRGKTSPVAGKTYSIVATVGGESIRATTRIPKPVALSSIEIDSLHFNSERDVEMKLTFQDPGEEKNYYQIRIYRDILNIPRTLKNGVWVEDRSKAYIIKYTFPYYSIGLIDELYVNDLFTDGFFNGKTYELRLKVQNFQPDKDDFPVHVVLISMNKEYYDYFTSVKLAQEAEGNPLLQPVQIYTNIENGLGIFAGYSVSEILLK